jgi:hypothetical protein
VYVLRHEGTPVYAGKSTYGKTFAERMGSHRRAMARGRWIFDELLGQDNILAGNLTYHEARALETYLIRTYKTKEFLRYNDIMHGASMSATAPGYDEAMRWAKWWADQWLG